jgi:formate dehydrogenase subunit delta
MQADELVRMANQVAQFFAPYSEDEAVAGVRDHLVAFWDPGMRRELLAVVRGATPSPVAPAPLVVRAAALLPRDAGA